MDHAITVRDLIWPMVWITAALGGIGLIGFILSIFADAWKH